MIGRTKDGRAVSVDLDGAADRARNVLANATVKEARAIWSKALRDAGMPRHQIALVMRCSRRSSQRDSQTETAEVLARFNPRD